MLTDQSQSKRGVTQSNKYKLYFQPNKAKYFRQKVDLPSNKDKKEYFARSNLI